MKYPISDFFDKQQQAKTNLTLVWTKTTLTANHVHHTGFITIQYQIICHVPLIFHTHIPQLWAFVSNFVLYIINLS